MVVLGLPAWYISAPSNIFTDLRLHYLKRIFIADANPGETSLLSMEDFLEISSLCECVKSVILKEFRNSIVFPTVFRKSEESS